MGAGARNTRTTDSNYATPSCLAMVMYSRLTPAGNILSILQRPRQNTTVMQCAQTKARAARMNGDTSASFHVSISPAADSTTTPWVSCHVALFIVVPPISVSSDDPRGASAFRCHSLTGVDSRNRHRYTNIEPPVRPAAGSVTPHYGHPRARIKQSANADSTPKVLCGTTTSRLPCGVYSPTKSHGI